MVDDCLVIFCFLSLILMMGAQRVSYSCDETGFIAFQKNYGKTYSSLEWTQRLEYFIAAC